MKVRFPVSAEAATDFLQQKPPREWSLRRFEPVCTLASRWKSTWIWQNQNEQVLLSSLITSPMIFFPPTHKHTPEHAIRLQFCRLMWLVLPYNVDRARRGVKTCSCESLTLLPEHIWALMRHRLFYRPLEKEEDAIWHERATNATAFLHSIQRGADICAPWTRTKLIICHMSFTMATVHCYLFGACPAQWSGLWRWFDFRMGPTSPNTSKAYHCTQHEDGEDSPYPCLSSMSVIVTAITCESWVHCLGEGDVATNGSMMILLKRPAEPLCHVLTTSGNQSKMMLRS